MLALCLATIGLVGCDDGEESSSSSASEQTTECTEATDCSARSNMVATCTDQGRCEWSCEGTYVDVDQDLGNGCECAPSADGVELCDAADNDCDGDVDEGFDLSSDPAHCGACENACAGEYASTQCVDGECRIAQCDPGRGDCDADLSNGCETDLGSSLDHCGSCGESCDELSGATSSCVDGSCVISACDEGREDCDGDLSNGCEATLASDLLHCGACGEPCAYPNAEASCIEGDCQMEACEAGYHDQNQDASDGCEYSCAFVSADDRPDMAAEDSNCDGIDGVVESSVFVSTSQDGGDDTNDGRSPDTPVATVARAMEIAWSCAPEPCDVLISQGVYQETVVLTAGISLYGGYDPATWQRDTATFEVVLEGQDPRAVIADTIDAPTELGGLTIRGMSPTTAGASTYALWVIDSPDDFLQLRDSHIEAGDGAPGLDGADGSPGQAGQPGSPASGAQGGTAGSNASCGAHGGDGGRAWDCNNAAGYASPGVIDETPGGAGGGNGANKCGGCDDFGGDGGQGQNGAAGLNGSPGTASGSPSGSFEVTGLWSGSSSSAGDRGHHGRGGGGGGAGGTDVDPWFCVYFSGTEIGGGGGGGGAGGCGGAGGGAGEVGGGSFGVVLVNSAVTIEETTITLGDGGAGGDGGDGATGGAGATGAPGFLPSSDGGGGGYGGDGGDGGAGAGGAGGCGGPSIGIAQVAGSQLTLSEVSYAAGTPGPGGTGGLGGASGGAGPTAAPGQAGCSGVRAETLVY